MGSRRRSCRAARRSSPCPTESPTGCARAMGCARARPCCATCPTSRWTMARTGCACGRAWASSAATRSSCTRARPRPGAVATSSSARSRACPGSISRCSARRTTPTPPSSPRWPAPRTPPIASTSCPASRSRRCWRDTAEADVGVSLLSDSCENHRLALPNKLFEYIAAGVPVVTSALPELERVVRGRGIGWTVDPADPADVRRGLTEALGARGDAALRARVAAAARRAALAGRAPAAAGALRAPGTRRRRPRAAGRSPLIRRTARRPRAGVGRRAAGSVSDRTQRVKKPTAFAP